MMRGKSAMACEAGHAPCFAGRLWTATRSTNADGQPNHWTRCAARARAAEMARARAAANAAAAEMWSGVRVEPAVALLAEYLPERPSTLERLLVPSGQRVVMVEKSRGQFVVRTTGYVDGTCDVEIRDGHEWFEAAAIGTGSVASAGTNAGTRLCRLNLPWVCDPRFLPLGQTGDFLVFVRTSILAPRRSTLWLRPGASGDTRVVPWPWPEPDRTNGMQLVLPRMSGDCVVLDMPPDVNFLHRLPPEVLAEYTGSIRAVHRDWDYKKTSVTGRLRCPFAVHEAVWDVRGVEAGQPPTETGFLFAGHDLSVDGCPGIIGRCNLESSGDEVCATVLLPWPRGRWASRTQLSVIPGTRILLIIAADGGGWMQGLDLGTGLSTELICPSAPCLGLRDDQPEAVDPDFNYAHAMGADGSLLFDSYSAACGAAYRSFLPASLLPPPRCDPRCACAAASAQPPPH